jgi:hypothetical protein
MSYSKFTSLTPSLIARKGEVAPAIVSATLGPLARKQGVVAGSAGAEGAFIEQSYMRWRSTRETDFASEGDPSHRPRARKLMVALTGVENDSLTVLAAKSGLTRHDVVRHALNGYFKSLAGESAETCRCISMLRSDTASATTAEPRGGNKRPH